MTVENLTQRKRGRFDGLLERMFSSRHSGEQLNSWPKGLDRAVDAVWVDRRPDNEFIYGAARVVEQRALPILKDKVERAKPLTHNGAYRSSENPGDPNYLEISAVPGVGVSIYFREHVGGTIIYSDTREGRTVTRRRQVLAVMNEDMTRLLSLSAEVFCKDFGSQETRTSSLVKIEYGEEMIEASLFRDDNPFDGWVEVDRTFRVPVTKAAPTVV